jgi:hypothetical protein
MKCLSCAAEIPGSFLADLSKSKGSRIALFNCPQCHAAHIQRVTVFLPDGNPSCEIRLWGPPTTTRRVQRGAGMAGASPR